MQQTAQQVNAMPRTTGTTGPSARDRSPPLDSSPHPVAFNEKGGSCSCMSCVQEKSYAATRSCDWLRHYVHGPAFLGASRFLDPWTTGIERLNWFGLVGWLVGSLARFLYVWECGPFLLLLLCVHLLQ